MKIRTTFFRVALAALAVSAVLLVARHTGTRGATFALMALGTVGTAAVVRDGTLPHGSFDVTLLETGTGYVFNNFTLQRNSKDISSMSARGHASRQKTILTDIVFSAEAQLADENTLSPENRQTFAIDADRDGNVEPYQVSKSGDTYTQDGEYKCKVDGKAMVAPLIYNNTTPAAPVAFAPASAASTVAITAVNLAVYTPRGITVTGNTWSATGLPAGLVIAAATGVISGTPTTPGTNVFTIKCTGTRTVENVTETITGAIKGSWVIT